MRVLRIHYIFLLYPWHAVCYIQELCQPTITVWLDFRPARICLLINYISSKVDLPLATGLLNLFKYTAIGSDPNNDL